MDEQVLNICKKFNMNFQYSILMDEFNNISKGTIEIIRVIDSIGFNMINKFWIPNTGISLADFVSNYKDELPLIFWELKRLGICIPDIPERVNEILLTRASIDNIKIVRFYKFYEFPDTLPGDLMEYNRMGYRLINFGKYDPLSPDIPGYLALFEGQIDEIKADPAQATREIIMSTKHAI